MEEWRANVRKLKEFAANRPEHLRRHLIEYFKLSGLVQLSLQVEGAHSAEIQISGSSIPVASNSPWSGVYFKDVPLAAAVVAPTGYRFAGWTGAIQESANPVKLTLLNNGILTAVFVRHP
jgi:hypothetical protein